MNFLETIAPNFLLLVVCATQKPMLAGIGGLLYAVSRALYGIGYAKAGPVGRYPGALLHDITIIILLIGAIWSVVIWKDSKNLEDQKFKVFPISLAKFDELYGGE